MVKISGYGKGGAHVKAHLMYISRHTMADKEKVALENDSRFACAWRRSTPRRNGRHSVHVPDRRWRGLFFGNR